METGHGLPLSRYRATRRTQVSDLISSQLPKHSYKKSDKQYIAVPNRLDLQFNVKAFNTVWRGDITYVWTGRRWGYLALVLD